MILRGSGSQCRSLSSVIITNMLIRIPEKVNKILTTLHDAGYEACIVGGCVRDSILGREPEDWDITTKALPQEVKTLFPRTIDTGMQHGTVTVMMGHGEDREGFEVTTYRIDGEYTDNRHPDSVTFTTDLREDLRRRDFTINAMAYNEKDGLIDLFGGMEDLRAGVIRAVGVPKERFEEDALRTMRAVRFAAQLGYRIEDETRAAIREMVGNLSSISAERIQTELNKLIVSDHPEYLREAYDLGITAVILPEFDTCMVTSQNSPYHKYNVGEHILKSMECIRADKVLRLAMLFHDIGKPACHTVDDNGRDHFYGHARISAELVDTVFRRLKYDNETRKKVTVLVRHHDDILGDTKVRFRKNIVRICGEVWDSREIIPDLLEVKEADALAHHEDWIDERMNRKESNRKMFEEILAEKDPLQLKDLAVKGGDLIACGFAPGEELGGVLRQMLQDVVADPAHNTREYLLEKYANPVEKH